MKKVVSVFFCIVVLFGLFAFSAGASAPILCPHCGSTAKLVGSREEGMYIVYKYRCTNSACGHTFESKFLAGGGSTRGGGAGRRDPLPGYTSDGIPTITSAGALTWIPDFMSDTGYSGNPVRNAFYVYTSGFETSICNKTWLDGTYPSWPKVDPVFSSCALKLYIYPPDGKDTFLMSSSPIRFYDGKFAVPVSGFYSCNTVKSVTTSSSSDGLYNFSGEKLYYSFTNKHYSKDATISLPRNLLPTVSSNFNMVKIESTIYSPVFTVVPDESNVIKQTNITINNNTFTGNIYQDTKNNLTYIYPQYSSVDDSGNTITKIFENPIIYNSTTNQYYTYDSTTNNYYYITYVTATPEPTASSEPTTSPDPSTTPTPTPAPGGDTGDTSSILDVLVEIRDNMIQGFADLKATLVQGWADLSANFTLAIENLNLNITNIFNKKFPDQSTPGTVQPSPSPEPVDPILPDTQNYIIPKMISNTFTDEHGTWVASGSSKYSDVFDFFHAFDRSTSDFWETNVSPSYLQIEIPDPENYYIDGYITRISKFNNRYSKDWTLQGSDDGETWDDLDTQKGQNLSDMEEHKYTLTLRKAYKYYRLNMSNYASSMCSLSHFNLLGYDAKDVVTPTPSPSPTPDPGTDPTPAPTDKPSNGNTTNFWTFIFGGGSDDGTDKGHKGILWALISLILAIISLLTGLGASAKYLFPFLPSGVITTIHICVIVLFLFAVIKFIRSFL